MFCLFAVPVHFALKFLVMCFGLAAQSIVCWGMSFPQALDCWLHLFPLCAHPEDGCAAFVYIWFLGCSCRRIKKFISVTPPRPLYVFFPLYVFCVRNMQHINFFLRLTYSVCISILPECMSVHHVCAPCLCLVSKETRRRYWILWNWIYRWLWATMLVLNSNLGPLQEQALLTTEPSLWLQEHITSRQTHPKCAHGWSSLGLVTL